MFKWPKGSIEDTWENARIRRLPKEYFYRTSDRCYYSFKKARLTPDEAQAWITTWMSVVGDIDNLFDGVRMTKIFVDNYQEINDRLRCPSKPLIKQALLSIGKRDWFK